MLPNDANMLLSYINTQLRDNYSSLSDLCEDKDIDSEEVINKLAGIGYKYDENLNKFIVK